MEVKCASKRGPHFLCIPCASNLMMMGKSKMKRLAIFLFISMAVITKSLYSHSSIIGQLMPLLLFFFLMLIPYKFSMMLKNRIFYKNLGTIKAGKLFKIAAIGEILFVCGIFYLFFGEEDFDAIAGLILKGILLLIAYIGVMTVLNALILDLPEHKFEVPISRKKKFMNGIYLSVTSPIALIISIVSGIIISPLLSQLWLYILVIFS
jgi:hypothetical protein